MYRDLRAINATYNTLPLQSTSYAYFNFNYPTEIASYINLNMSDPSKKIAETVRDEYQEQKANNNRIDSVAARELEREIEAKNKKAEADKEKADKASKAGSSKGG